MIAVIFEVLPKPGRAERYFELAQALQAELARQDGFISVERFESVSTPGKFVSLSFWRDEAAVLAWKAHAGHGAAQREGRADVFADFRITVAQALRQYDMAGGGQRPQTASA